MNRHPWDVIRAMRTTVERIPDIAGGGVHESTLRSFQILDEVKKMLARGDSPETIRTFIEWAERKDSPSP